MARRILIGCGVLIVVCLIGAAIFYFTAGKQLVGLVQGLSDTSNNFMGDLRDGKYADASALCSPDFQKTDCSAATLQSKIEGANAKPTSWNFDSTNAQNNITAMTGTATFANGQTGTVSLTLTLDSTNQKWQIVGYSLSPNTP